MIKVLLIARNHLRDQRWVLTTMFAYALIMSSVFAFFVGQPSAEDAHFFVEQQLWFGVLFSVFLATAAVHTDMRTRRILGIMSKAVHRSQYLLGVLAGISAAMVTYCLLVAIAGEYIAARSGYRFEGLWPLAAQIAFASVTVACVGIMFGTFMSPLYATASTFALLTVIPFLALHVRSWIILWSPVTFLLAQTTEGFRYSPPMPLPTVILLTFCQAVLFFVVGLAIFSRRDLARSTE
jgi:hypothetical protein